MGNKLLNEYSPETSERKYFIAQVTRDSETVSLTTNDWKRCKDFIITGFGHERSDIEFTDTDIKSLTKDLSYYGWTERTYNNTKIVRGFIIPVKRLYISVLFDNPNIIKRIQFKSKDIDPSSDNETLLRIINELFDTVPTTFGVNLSYTMTEEALELLKTNYFISHIIGDPPGYLSISLIFE